MRVLCNKEYVSKSLLHCQYPLTDDLFYNSYILQFMKVFSAIPNELLEPGKRCLDVGCGEGRMLLLLKAFGLDSYGVDKEVFQVSNLKGVLLESLLKDLFQEHRVHVLALNIETEPLEYPNSFFDLVVFQEVIEHLHNSPKLALDEMKRVLKPGGYLIVSTPNIANLKKRINLLKGNSIHWNLKDYYNYKYVSPPNREYIGHTREFTLKELSHMLDWAGFSIKKAETWNVQGQLRFKDLIPYWSIRRGTGLWQLIKQFSKKISPDLEEIYPDLGEYCLIVARS